MGTNVSKLVSQRRHRGVAALCAIGLALTGSLISATTAAAATPPTIAIGDVTVVEGNARTTSARVTVRLSNPVSTTTLVRYVTAGGTATAGTDYRHRSATVRIPPGKTSAAITIAVVGDTAAEATETLSVRLTGAGGIAISDGTGAVTIRDDEGTGGVSIGDAVVWEGDAKAGLVKLTVVLGAATGTDTVVSYRLANGTASAPDDYRARSGRARVRAGRTTATITPSFFGDSVLEDDEAFQVVLTGTGTSGVAISDGVGTVTIRNDEPASTPPPPPPPPAAPEAPADLTVVPGPFPRYLTADWTAPASELPITGYDLEVTRGSTTNVVTNATAPNQFGCGLAVMTDTCTVRVRARNASGDGAWSSPVTASTWSPPAAPPNLTVLAGGGVVTWEVPASDRPIDHYEVQQQLSGSTSWTHVATTTLTHASTTCGFCSVRVSGYSEVGFGPWSAVAIALPGPPTGLTATRDESNHELVHVAWSPGDPGSHPVTSYEIFVNGIPLAPTSATNADVFIRSILTWEIQVYARNLVGRSIIPASISLPAG